MAKVFETISDSMRAWIEAQRMFFVASAPLDGNGHINCSPKGMDSLRVLDETTVAYLDLTGSGAETIAHLRENGRVVIMFCAFEGPPKIVRLHGRGTAIAPESTEWSELRTHFPGHSGARTIIRVELTRISDSCGYSVPKFDFVEQRDGLEKWAQKKGTDGIADYQEKNNRRSLDGLPALED